MKFPFPSVAQGWNLTEALASSDTSLWITSLWEALIGQFCIERCFNYQSKLMCRTFYKAQLYRGVVGIMNQFLFWHLDNFVNLFKLLAFISLILFRLSRRFFVNLAISLANVSGLKNLHRFLKKSSCDCIRLWMEAWHLKLDCPQLTYPNHILTTLSGSNPVLAYLTKKLHYFISRWFS